MKRIALLLCLVVACSSKKKKEEPPVTDQPKTVEPAAPKEPTPQEAVVKLASCTDYAVCLDAQKPLLKNGAPVAQDLVKIATDTTKPKDPREAAATVLTELKVKETGMPMWEAAKAEKDFLLRGPLYKAAGASGDDAVFEAAKVHLMTEAGWDDRIEINKALVPFGKKTFDWASAAIVKTKKFNELTRYSDLISQTATAADVPAMQAMLGTIKESMARSEIARALIQNGDLKAFDVLLEGITSKDNLERNHATGMLSDVVEKVPPERKAEFAAAVEKAKTTDTASTYTQWDSVLGKLK